MECYLHCTAVHALHFQPCSYSENFSFNTFPISFVCLLKKTVQAGASTFLCKLTNCAAFMNPFWCVPKIPKVTRLVKCGAERPLTQDAKSILTLSVQEAPAEQRARCGGSYPHRPCHRAPVGCPRDTCSSSCRWCCSRTRRSPLHPLRTH